MNVEAKRVESIEWILSLSEDEWNKIYAIKEAIASGEVAAYSTKGKSFTKKRYVKHINGIRENVKDGARTYTTHGVRNFV